MRTTTFCICRKREEARVETALNSDRFANVVIAQKAIVPALPAFSPLAGHAAGPGAFRNGERGIRVYRRSAR